MKWSFIALITAGLCWSGAPSAQARARKGPRGPKASDARKSPAAGKAPRARKKGKVTAKAIQKKVVVKKKLTRKEKRRAKRLWARGKKLFAKKKYAPAVVVFKQAYAIRKHPIILYNIALALGLSGNKLESAIHLRQYRALKKGFLRNLPAVLQQVLDDTGVLVITTPDPKAAILVDGHQVGLGSARITALVGRRAVDIIVKTRIVARRIIDLGSDAIKYWELLEIPSAPEVRPRDQPPRRKVARRVVTPPPRRVAPPTRWQKMRTLHWTYFVGAAGLAVAAMGASIGLSVTIQKIDSDCRAAPCTTSESDRGFTLQKAANALWGVTAGAAVAAGVLVLFTRWKQKRERPRITVQPTFAPGSVGLGLRWEH